MELSKQYQPSTYIDCAYLYFRNSMFKGYTFLTLLNTFVLSFREIKDLNSFLEVLIPTLTVFFLILILNLESHGVSRKKILFIFCELINFNSYCYGLFIAPLRTEIHLIVSVVSTCELQMVGSSRFENILIMLKILVVWYIGPILLGYKEFPTDITSYLSLVNLLIILSIIFVCRKKLEDEYGQVILNIQKLKMHLSNIIQGISESVLILSETQEILLFNISCQKLFQTNNSDEIKEALTNLKYSENPGDSLLDQNSLYEEILKYLASESKDGITFGINELNGNSYEWRGTKSALDGSKIVTLTARDISALIAYERAKAESKTILLRTVSHEIRTHTNTIVNLSDSLLEEHTKDKQIDKAKIINISSKLLLNLINDLLDFSKIVADCFAINKYEVNLRNFMQEIYSLFEFQSKQRNLEYRLFIDPLLPEIIITDPDRLRQVIVNLLSNSLKFTIQGKIRLEAFLTEQATMQIRLTDTGIGISPNKINNLFNAFFTTQDLRLNPHGCGLGLYISNRLVQILGTGSIQVISQIHEGSVFSFEIDLGEKNRISIVSTKEELEEMSISDERTCEATIRNITTHDSFTSIRPEILIVDDNEFNILVMKNFLGSAGYDFVEARSGLEAVEKVLKANAAAFHLKVVVMDREMPGMSGPEAAREIFKLYQDKKIAYMPTLIGYSADDSEDSIRLCQESGMKECLCKTASKNAFLNLIKKYLICK